MKFQPIVETCCCDSANDVEGISIVLAKAVPPKDEGERVSAEKLIKCFMVTISSNALVCVIENLQGKT